MSTTTPDALTEMRSSGTLLIVAGVISIVCGILALVFPDATLLAIGIITGINVVVLGILGLISAVDDDLPTGVRILDALAGVLGVLAGIVIMRRPGETLLVLVLALGLWLVIKGILDAIAALRGPSDGRGLVLLTAAVDLAIGVLILALPDLGLGTLALLVGLAFIVRGVMTVALGFAARKAAKALGPGPGAAPGAGLTIVASPDSPEQASCRSRSRGRHDQTGRSSATPRCAVRTSPTMSYVDVERHLAAAMARD